ncbi:Kiwa anti-phage protein KwaB-like domain-containing protein [Cuniculiplasma divulgatum]|jgi:hypothetical protein|uniref:DUF4868 domain-containing protein n=1 Tax=Cuniculiplasma divulgatum TaxID=1673428 RepID=A0A1N5TNW1_9ARCH|nr:Kiwa anti-phage protein KwaB-like domain-containing protein [Cuniculiplasma divulgatum]MCL6015230.1 DUF4868 domain-containing protein [Candidatus Thermoplasmatota archaeon]OWP54696.1 MAG: hypothetical protein B2I18_05525 [Cuniculiplasma sp. C_DKE]WMT48793.1 MAG: DUF4868 domain-containing protein [Thermoplasmatales archaeon]SIM49648.1 hypothetical protein CSP5_0626 [Cuniculiplasma divulgatum]SJK84480.1 hypothetical protein CPM_0606 [Cuniculiplasma divulgatum]
MKIYESSFTEKKLEEMYNLIKETDGSKVQLYAISVEKNKEKEKIWTVNTLSITKSLGDEMIESAKGYLIQKSQLRIKDFDLKSDLSPEYLIGKLADDQVPVLNKIISEMKRSDNSPISYGELSKSTHLIGFAIEIGEKITIFNKVTKARLLNPKKYLYLVESRTGELTHLKENNLLSIPNSIDAILYEDPLYILNVNHFLSLFDYGEAFTKFIDNAKTSLANIVDDVQYVIDETSPHIMEFKRLASACAGYVDRIVRENTNLEPIAKSYNLEISFSNGKISVKNSKLKDILSLLNGQAVRDELFKEKYLAREKEKV